MPGYEQTKVTNDDQYSSVYKSVGQVIKENINQCCRTQCFDYIDRKKISANQ